MNQLKAFMSIPALADNTPGAVGRFGELSTYASTFSREKRNWVRGTAPDVELITLSILDEMNQVATPNTTYMTSLVELGQFIYNQYISGSIPTNANKNAFINAIRQEFPQFTEIVIGQLLSGNQPSRNMPDYISFKCTDGKNQYLNKIWFSDSHLRTQYEDYTIIIIPPVQDIDDLNTGIESVGNVLAQYTAAQTIQRVQNVVGQHPQSSLMTLTLTWHDPSNINNTRKTDWSMVVYGQAGVDADAIKNAIREYIGNNSANNNWNTIYPELYSDNEFIVIPFWNNLAFPDNAMDTGIYSSTLTYGSILSTVEPRLPNSYKTLTSLSTYMHNNLAVMQSVYRSLMLAVMGNPNNAGGVTHISHKYKDYSAIATTSPDFARMTTMTQEFVLSLNKALEVARTSQPTDPIPNGYTRAVRNNRYYITFESHGHTFMVLTKYSHDFTGL